MPTRLIVAIVLVIIGMAFVLNLLANYYCALQRGKEARTMATIREWAIEIEAYQRRTGELPLSPAQRLLPIHLAAARLKCSASAFDGWGNELYAANLEGKHTISSPGRDGVREALPNPYTVNISPDRDIVFQDGSFLSFPPGVHGPFRRLKDYL